MTDNTPGTGPEPPNPFSREGAAPDAGQTAGADEPHGASALQPGAPSETGGHANQQPGHGQPLPDPNPQYEQAPYGQPQYGQPQQDPYGQPQYGQTQYGQDPHGQPQYGQAQYGQAQYDQPGDGTAPAAGYGQEYGTAYDQSGYGMSPYQGGYGGYSAYGTAPMDQPQATSALVTGIIGLIGGFLGGLFGLVGIAGIVLGRKSQRAIDADPARWTGRGKATAGLVTGIFGLVLLVLWVVLWVVLFAVVAANS